MANRLLVPAPGPIRVLGFHGTSAAAADAILREGFQPSQNDYDWLGDGVYFFQDAPARAWEWAVRLHDDQAAVIGTHILYDREEWIDLLDISWASVLNHAYSEYLAISRQTELPMPRQTTMAHRLDREVINYVVGILEDEGGIIRAVRAAFSEGKPVYPNSALFDRAHVQIAVRDTSVIDEIWLERPGGLHGRYP